MTTLHEVEVGEVRLAAEGMYMPSRDMQSDMHEMDVENILCSTDNDTDIRNEGEMKEDLPKNTNNKTNSNRTHTQSLQSNTDSRIEEGSDVNASVKVSESEAKQEQVTEVTPDTSSSAMVESSNEVLKTAEDQLVPPGSQVSISGLQQAPQLNEKIGKIKAYVKNKGRYKVIIDGVGKALLKA